MRNFKRDKELVAEVYFISFLLGFLYLSFSVILNPFKQIGI